MNRILLVLKKLMYYQKLRYHRSFSNNIHFSTSVKFHFFSNYYANSFFPLTDVFYKQSSDQVSLSPFVMGDVYVAKGNFSFGLIFDHLSSFLNNENYLTPSYILPAPTVRLSIKWGFVD